MAETNAGKSGRGGGRERQRPQPPPAASYQPGTEGAGQRPSIFFGTSQETGPSGRGQFFLFLRQVRFKQVQRGFKVFRREGVGPPVTTDLVPVQMECNKHEMTGRFAFRQNLCPTFFNGSFNGRGFLDVADRLGLFLLAVPLQAFRLLGCRLLGWLVFIRGPSSSWQFCGLPSRSFQFPLLSLGVEVDEAFKR